MPMPMLIILYDLISYLVEWNGIGNGDGKNITKRIRGEREDGGNDSKERALHASCKSKF